MTREIIQLDCEEPHELLFRIQVEGNDVSPARVRLVCEGDEMSYMFSGRSSGEEGIVQFALPVMKGKIREGVHPARVEVLIDNKYFAPVSFDIDFKQPVKVFAEAVKVLPPVAKRGEIKVSAEPVALRQSEPAARPIVIEPPVPVAIPVEHAPTETTVVSTTINTLEEPELTPTPVQPNPELLPIPEPTSPVVPVPPPPPPPAQPPRPRAGSLRDRYQKKSSS